MNATGLIWVMLGSAVGGGGRYWLAGWVDARLHSAFPYGTLTVNLLGSLLIGALAVAALPESRWFLGEAGRQGLMIGLLGGFTTFSAFSLQTLALLQSGQQALALANILASVTLCLAGVWLGFAVASGVLR